MTPITIDFTRCAQEWIAAWNSHDLERILEHYSEDIELISPFVSKLAAPNDGAVRGKTALREYFARGLHAFPTLRFDFIRLYRGVRSCVVEYHSVNGLRTAELMEYDDDSKVCRVLAHYFEETHPGS
jgi:ketosteroid isomerase-like protein